MINLRILPLLTGATVAVVIGLTDNGWALAFGMGLSWLSAPRWWLGIRSATNEAPRHHPMVILLIGGLV